jgi:hypothetical protein
MIIEVILQWLMSVSNYAVSLLPTAGDVFKNISNLDLSFFKQISMVNGYLPIQETGYIFIAYLSFSAIFIVLSGIVNAYRLVRMR